MLPWGTFFRVWKLSFVLFLTEVTKVDSVLAKPSEFWSTHQDGSPKKLYLKGDAFCHWMEDEHGFVVVKSEQDFYFAAERDENGELIPSEFKVGHHDPHMLKLDKNLRPHTKRQQSEEVMERKRGRAGAGNGRRLNELTTGDLKNLVVPIRFNDHQGRHLPSKEDIELLWNAPNGHPAHYATTNMSIRDFYLENSYGKLDIDSTVIDWVTVSQDESYYAAGVSGGTSQLMELLVEVLDEVDKEIDFSSFDENGDGYIDAIAFVHSGYGAEYGGTDAYGTYSDDRIWSHKWSIFNPITYAYDPWESEEGIYVQDYHMETILDGTSGSTISTIAVGAHETGHFLGLPDLYDTDGSSSGIDSWGIMANSWGWDGTGDVPPSFSIWSRYMLGWITPVDITEPGTYSLNDVESHEEAFLISSPYPDGEYLLIENRQPKLSDRQIPQGGLLIWHIDESAYSVNNLEGYWGQAMWPENGMHYLVSVLQADGEFDLEKGYSADAGDVFSGPNAILHNSYDRHPSSLGYQFGQIVSAEFEIRNVSNENDGSVSFIMHSDDPFPLNSTAFDCNDLLSVEMYDSWGDGWQGTVFTLYAMPDYSEIQSVSLYGGSYGEQCLDVELDSCYYFASSLIGSWTSEVSWSLCDFTGIYSSELYFCLDANGTCHQEDGCGDSGLSVHLYDAYGDGWNGLVFDLYEQEEDGTIGDSIQSVTFEDGYSATYCLSTEPNSCYIFEASTHGSWDSEAYWVLCDQLGYSDTSWAFCVDDEGECFVAVENCTNDQLTLEMYDSWGDGWTGTEFALISVDDEQLQTVTLDSGAYGRECLDVENDNCYYFYPTNYGSWASELSWELCGTTGYFDSFLYLCVDDEGNCAAGDSCAEDGGLTLLTYDSYGDGWQGTVFTLYEDDDSIVESVTLSDGYFDFNCLDTSEGHCYVFEASAAGSYTSEISWELCGEIGYYWTSLSFCIHSNGTCYLPENDCSSDLSLVLSDSYGDGWSGNYFSLFSGDFYEELESVTLMDGSSMERCLDIEWGSCYYFALSNVGSWLSEVSWELCGTTGSIDTELNFCVDETTGDCITPVNCSSALFVSQYDSYGDGWNGFHFSLYGEDDDSDALQTVGLSWGTSSEKCLNVEENSCYIFKISSIGSWGSELSWEICGVTGDFETELSFCVDSSGNCYNTSTETIDSTDVGNDWWNSNSSGDCNNSLSVTMGDSYGDGWNGYYFSLYSVDDTSSALHSITLDSGHSGGTCLDVEFGTCYSFSASSLGSWGYEISWEICDTTGIFTTELSFCLDEDGNCFNVSTETTDSTDVGNDWWNSNSSGECNNSLSVTMGDSYGDGWNGYYFSLYSVDDTSSALQSITLDSGHSGETCLDVEFGTCYTFSASSLGSWGYEISWEICDTTGIHTTELSFCLDEDGDCFDVLADSETSGTWIDCSWWGCTGTWTDTSGSGSCVDRCDSTTGSCFCDDSCYFYGDCCDDVCSACGYSCDCDSAVNVNTFDSYGDGWNGYYFGIYSVDDTSSVLQLITLLDGWEGETCLNVELDACYMYTLAFGGSYGYEISWELCGETGYYNTELSFCLDEDGNCYDVSTGLTNDDDSWITYTTAFSDGTSGSCQGNCGNYAGSCYCDDSCVSYGDCCDDACSACNVCGFGEDECDDDDSVEISLYDYYGDGWDEWKFSVYSEDDTSTPLETVELEYGHSLHTCLNIEFGSCYIYRASSGGSFYSDISWEICDVIGYYNTQLSFCLDEDGECYDVSAENIEIDDSWFSDFDWGWNFWDSTDTVWTATWGWEDWSWLSETGECESHLYVTKYDSYGDGWSGWYFSLFSADDTSTALQTETLYYGSMHETCLDIEYDSCYMFSATWGYSWPSEVSWEICDTIGFYNTQLSFCLDEDGNCYDVSTEEIEIPDSWSSGSFWESGYTALWDGSTNEGSWFNMFSSATDKEECNSTFLMHTYDSFGDGWNGFSFSLYTADNLSILQSVTMDDGYSRLTCLDTEVGSCYVLHVSDYGSWPNELSWEICGEFGYYNTEISFCLDETGSCYNVSKETLVNISFISDSATSDFDCAGASVSLVMFDSFEDGWNGNYFSLYSVEDTSTALQEVTLESGAEGRACLEVESGSCYIFMVSTSLSYASELSWKLCDTYGDAVSSLAFCTNGEGGCSWASLDEGSSEEIPFEDMGPCTMHENCTDSEFCYNEGFCTPCTNCLYCDYGIDETCGYCGIEFPVNEDVDCTNSDDDTLSGASNLKGSAFQLLLVLVPPAILFIKALFY